jgi:hypothetical protein
MFFHDITPEESVTVYKKQAVPAVRNSIALSEKETKAKQSPTTAYVKNRKKTLWLLCPVLPVNSQSLERYYLHNWQSMGNDVPSSVCTYRVRAELTFSEAHLLQCLQ